MSRGWLAQHREDIWKLGVEHRESLMSQYLERHPSKERPPLHMVCDDLIEEIQEARLLEAPLPLDRYAQTEIKRGRPIITVNSLIQQMDGVKDEYGVRNLAVWHESIHIPVDVERRGIPPLTDLRSGLEGSTSSPFLCHAAGKRHDGWNLHEQAIEAAALAAAIADADLHRCPRYGKFLQLAAHSGDMGPEGWRLLRGIATAIGVNRSALCRYFEQHGLCRVDKGFGTNRLIGTAPPFRGFICLEPASATQRSVA